MKNGKIKVAILEKCGKPLTLGEVQLPSELLFGQVLVKLLYSGICGAQINEIDAIKGPDKFLPHLLGHEGSGVVQEIGPGVSTVKEGDHVVCAVSGKNIPLNQLTYWNVELQEAYYSPKEAQQRYEELNKK